VCDPTAKPLLTLVPSFPATVTILRTQDQQRLHALYALQCGCCRHTHTHCCSAITQSYTATILAVCCDNSSSSTDDNHYYSCYCYHFLLLMLQQLRLVYVALNEVPLLEVFVVADLDTTLCTCNHALSICLEVLKHLELAFVHNSA
jgi:hypothetical protein